MKSMVGGFLSFADMAIHTAKLAGQMTSDKVWIDAGRKFDCGSQCPGVDGSIEYC